MENQNKQSEGIPIGEYIAETKRDWRDREKLTEIKRQTSEIEKQTIEIPKQTLQLARQTKILFWTLIFTILIFIGSLLF